MVRIQDRPSLRALDLATERRPRTATLPPAPALVAEDGERGADGVPEAWLDPISAEIMARPVAVRAGSQTEVYDARSLDTLVETQGAEHAACVNEHQVALSFQADGLPARSTPPGTFAAKSPFSRVPFETQAVATSGALGFFQRLTRTTPTVVKSTHLPALAEKIHTFLAADATVWGALSDDQRDAIEAAQALLNVDRGVAVRRVLNTVDLKPTFAKHFLAAVGETAI